MISDAVFFDGAGNVALMNDIYGMRKELTLLMMMVLFISFLGFLLENIWLAFTKGFMDNRNVIMPFLLGYGLLVVGIYFIMGEPKEGYITLLGKEVISGRLLYYLMAFAIVSVGEMILGTLVERFLGFEYWNYEWIPLHITKYTSVPTSMGFAAIITFFMERVFPVAMDLAEGIYTEKATVICAFLLVLCSIDTVMSFIKMREGHGINRLWKIELGGSNKRDGIEILKF